MTLGGQSDGRARGSKGNARALQTNNEGSEPKIGWNWGPPPGKVLQPRPLDSLKMPRLTNINDALFYIFGYDQCKLL